MTKMKMEIRLKIKIQHLIMMLRMKIFKSFLSSFSETFLYIFQSYFLFISLSFKNLIPSGKSSLTTDGKPANCPSLYNLIAKAKARNENAIQPYDSSKGLTDTNPDYRDLPFLTT